MNEPTCFIKAKDRKVYGWISPHSGLFLCHALPIQAKSRLQLSVFDVSEYQKTFYYEGTGINSKKWMILEK